MSVAPMQSIASVTPFHRRGLVDGATRSARRGGPRVRALVVVLSASVAAALGGSSCAAAREDDATLSTSSSSGGAGGAGGGPDRLFGEAAFVAYCGDCHGDDGAGSKDGPQILDPVVGYATYVTRHGRDEMGFPDPMPAFSDGALTDDQLSSILDWLRLAPHPDSGFDLHVRFCGNCHGADASGGRANEGIAGEEADEVEESIREGHGGTDYGDAESYMPKWSSTDISDAEIASIAAWLSSLDDD